MTDNILEVKDLVKDFGQGIRAVDGIDFEVRRGEIFGFLGPNGAGKSTTIKILTTLLDKTSGAVTLDGMDLDEDPAAIRRVIGYASQEVGVDDDLTARENLILQCRFYHVPRHETDRRVEDILRTVGLDFATDRRAGKFSGGMKKRLDLASALVSEPKLLFLDEPTTGLDPQNRNAIWDYIRELNRKGTTIFLTTQYMEEADRLAERLCIVDEGRIVAQGTPAEMKASIGKDIIRISLKGPEDTEQRKAAVKVLEEYEEVHETQDCEFGIVVYVENGPQLVPRIVRTLDSMGLEIAELTLSAPSLDDVFLKYTGHLLKVEEAPVKKGGRRMMR
jgi:ABC-2 type transport system ATP-binding protein